jgi:hypothetical protein
MKEINVILTREEIRVIHQALNEICNGIHFEDSEFETRMGTERQTARQLMLKLQKKYENDSTL